MLCIFNYFFKPLFIQLLTKEKGVHLTVLGLITLDPTSFLPIHLWVFFFYLPLGSVGELILDTLTSEYVVSSGEEVVSVHSIKYDKANVNQ